jgi:hypothetical protein
VGPVEVTDALPSPWLLLPGGASAATVKFLGDDVPVHIFLAKAMGCPPDFFDGKDGVGPSVDESSDLEVLSYHELPRYHEGGWTC